MREPARSQLRNLLLIWAAACLVGLAGYLVALAVTIYGFVQAFASGSDRPLLSSLLPMVIGTALQAMLVTLFVGVRDRFEARCWDLIASDTGAIIVDGGAQALAGQTDGNEKRLADVRARQARRFSKRLRTLIEQAWPERTGG